MYTFVTQLLQPFLLFHVLLWLVVLDLWRRRRESRGRLLLLTLGVLVLSLMSTPATAHLALGTLEWQYPPVDELPADAEAIVVLGGAVVPLDADETEYTLAPDSLLRCLHAAKLYRQRRLPLLVCGGKVDPSSSQPTVASVMADFLRSQGVDDADLLVEDRSRTTYENALEARRLLEDRGIRRVVLVTDAYHMPRSERCFRRQGLDTFPSPCCPQTAHQRWGVFEFLPDSYAPLAFSQAAHEWLGLAWYGLRGRL